jgi:hypothetical protein
MEPMTTNDGPWPAMELHLRSDRPAAYWQPRADGHSASRKRPG